MMPSLLLLSLASIVALINPVFVSSSDSLYINTPAGRILKACVHTVPSGSHIRSLPDHTQHVSLASGAFHSIIPQCDTSTHTLFESTTQSSSSPSSFLSSPLTPNDDPFPADYDGWTAYTAFKSPTGNFDSFLGTFSVPDAPTSTPDILYIFTGLQSVDWIPKRDPIQPAGVFDIIQPVLQFPGDGGSYWSVKSWYVTTDAGAIQSDEQQVNVGDSIFGNMTRIAGNEWFIGSTSVKTGLSVQITVTQDRLALQPWAYNTLECYGCTDCTTYPPTLPSIFTDLKLLSNDAPIQPDWIVNPKKSPELKCHENAIVNNDGTVTIVFQ